MRLENQVRYMYTQDSLLCWHIKLTRGSHSWGGSWWWGPVSIRVGVGILVALTNGATLKMVVSSQRMTKPLPESILMSQGTSCEAEYDHSRHEVGSES